jgi:hypothetical protein
VASYAVVLAFMLALTYAAVPVLAARQRWPGPDGMPGGTHA